MHREEIFCQSSNGKSHYSVRTARVEHFLGKYPSVFARHRLNIGINTKLEVTFTTWQDKPVYLRSLPTPKILKDDLLVELALMEKDRILSSLPFSKFSSPIFGQRKPKAKLRIQLEPHRINLRIKHEYGEHNHWVTNILDAAQHIAGMKFFCKLDCSQAYHCIQMANEQSVQLLSFNFGSRNLAYKRLAQELNTSLSAFTTAIKEYLESVLKADRRAKYVDDTRVAAHTATNLTEILDHVLQQINRARLKRFAGFVDIYRQCTVLNFQTIQFH